MSETPLTERIRPDRTPPDLAAYRRSGGYQAVDKAVHGLSPEEGRDLVSDANLRGATLERKLEEIFGK